METSTGNDADRFTDSSSSNSDTVSTSRNHASRFPVLRFLRSPVTTFLEYSGVLPSRSSNLDDTERLVPFRRARDGQFHGTSDDPAGAARNGEVSIRIIGSEERDRIDYNDGITGYRLNGEVAHGGNEGSGGGDGESDRISDASSLSGLENGEREDGDATTSGNGNRDASYQRYDIQQVARLIEQILPFSLLLLVVFIRQHLQGFFLTIWITTVIFKSNDILKKQTALKAEKKLYVLVGICLIFLLHVIGVYWWYWSLDLLHPLIMLPPTSVPPFWHAIFIILVNDTMVRQLAMVLKCVLLMYYKNGRSHNFRRQGQMLTLVEYTLLFYRAMLPVPVWYRFFLNKDYGNLFSSLTTGLYLTIKLASIVEKVRSFSVALRALSRKEIHYGTHATDEQVNSVGDLCAICQEKMQAPILLCCKHIFCEDCVSEWFERERTCPLCRALVRPPELRSFGDGSTSLLFQLF
ncbi:E3 ubiquitin-protein ligase RNFT1-like [Impatiens glandulifera]|uniref:E3 ubiquitin-protein ligase RNFT1-like n=1 Tax=Impatiens glandulifera TaxID=253017 RepID=UPI001FB0E0C6|nr:E3 ubiquitin-protein ligase RNFT1-like [Impatiens glandulifera]